MRHHSRKKTERILKNPPFTFKLYMYEQQITVK